MRSAQAAPIAGEAPVQVAVGRFRAPLEVARGLFGDLAQSHLGRQLGEIDQQERGDSGIGGWPS